MLIHFIAVFIAFSPQEDPEIGRLIRALNEGSAESRIEAQDNLVTLGDAALSALRSTLEGSHVGLRLQVRATIDIIERLREERKSDSERRAALLQSSEMAQDKRRLDMPYVGWTDGAMFETNARAFNGG